MSGEAAAAAELTAAPSGRRSFAHCGLAQSRQRPAHAATVSQLADWWCWRAPALADRYRIARAYAARRAGRREQRPPSLRVCTAEGRHSSPATPRRLPSSAPARAFPHRSRRLWVGLAGATHKSRGVLSQCRQQPQARGRAWPMHRARLSRLRASGRQPSQSSFPVDASVARMPPQPHVAQHAATGSDMRGSGLHSPSG